MREWAIRLLILFGRKVHVGPRGYFKSKAIKDSVVGAYQTQLRDLSKISQSTADEKDKNALLQLLTKYGPPLDTRRSGSVGFLPEATVLHAFNDHDTIVLIDEVPYILVMNSTSGLYPGAEIIPSPVYVCGTQTIQIPRGPSASLTILKEVAKEDLSEVVLGKSSTPPADSSASAQADSSASAGGSGGGYRVWYDKSGSFSIEAVLLEATTTEVVLRKKDGKIVRVPRARLSEADQRYLRQ